MSESEWRKRAAALAEQQDNRPGPRGRPTEEELRRSDLPRTLRWVEDESVSQRRLFDPSMKHHSNAFRAGDPEFADPADGVAWRAARRRAMDLVLAAVFASPWRDHLVLRGSVLLAEWFGEAAREPGDLDFVVVPQDWKLEDADAGAMLDGIPRAAEAAANARSTAPAGGPEVRFDAEEAVRAGIWTYDRVPGVRLVLPWSCAGTPGGHVQLDLVFNEHLPLPPQELPVRGVRLRCAGPELSLAWKLAWLATDLHPEGKDLYDAVLLAEHCTLDYAAMGAVFLSGNAEAADEYLTRPPGPELVDRMDPGIGWQHFYLEYPGAEVEPAVLLSRLRAALAPTFGSAPQDPQERLRVWRGQRMPRE